MRAVFLSLVFLPILSAAGCGADDVVRVRVQLEPDRSAAVHVSSLTVPDSKGPMEDHAKSVQWSDRAMLFTSAGKVADLDGLQLYDIEFRAGRTDSGMSYVSVTLPRGDDARWFRALAPTRQQRAVVQKTFDPEDNFGKVGNAVKLEIVVPGAIGGHGVQPRGRGVVNDAERSKATLLVPIDAALAPGGALIWDITWR